MRPLVLVMSEGCRTFARKKLRDARGAYRAARALLEHTLEVAETAGEVVLCAPSDPETEALAARRGIAFLPQIQGLLADRIRAATAALAPTRSNAPLILLGDDCPGVSEPLLDQVASALARGAGSVWGRARDGGFWVLGLARWNEGLFASLAAAVEWGGRRAGLTLARFLGDVPGETVELPQLPDLDGPDDLPVAIRSAPKPLARLLSQVATGPVAPENAVFLPAWADRSLPLLPRPPPA